LGCRFCCGAQNSKKSFFLLTFPQGLEWKICLLVNCVMSMGLVYRNMGISLFSRKYELMMLTWKDKKKKEIKLEKKVDLIFIFLESCAKFGVSSFFSCFLSCLGCLIRYKAIINSYLRKFVYYNVVYFLFCVFCYTPAKFILISFFCCFLRCVRSFEFCSILLTMYNF
jgi:hypothetical protein